MPLEAGSRAAHLAAVKAAKTRWGGKKSHTKNEKKKGKMSHAARVAAAKKAARTRKRNQEK